MINPSSLQQLNEEYIKDMHRKASHYRLVASVRSKQKYPIKMISSRWLNFMRSLGAKMKRLAKSHSIPEMILNAEDV